MLGDVEPSGAWGGDVTAGPTGPGGVKPRLAAAYPWKGFYFTLYHPDGSSDASKKIAASGLKAVAPLIEAGAKWLGVTVRQISPVLDPKSVRIGDVEAKYVKSVGGSLLDIPMPGSVGMQGLGQVDIKQVAVKTTVTEVSKTAAQTAATSLGSSVPVAGVAAAAAGVIMDPRGSFASSGASLQTTSAVASTSMISAGTIAACLPIIGFAIAGAMAIKAFFDYRKGKAVAKREEHRWKHFGAMTKGIIDVLKDEAKTLASELVARGVSIQKTGNDAALALHYTTQLMNARMYLVERNAARIKSASAAEKKKIRVVKFSKTLSRIDLLRFLLQAARDMRILNTVIQTYPAAVSPATMQKLMEETLKHPKVKALKVLPKTTKAKLGEMASPAELSAYQGGTSEDIPTEGAPPPMTQEELETVA